MKNRIAFLFLLIFFSQCQPSGTSHSDNSQQQLTTAAPPVSDTNNPSNTDSNNTNTTHNSVGVIASKTPSSANVPNTTNSQLESNGKKSGASTPSVSGENSDDDHAELADLPTDAALLYKGLLPKSQTFDLNTAETELKRFDLRGGTVVIVNPKSFEFEDGTPVYGDITFKVTEYLKKSEMVLSPLTTITHDNRPLESAGMIYAYAFAKGKLLKLKKGEEMQVGFRVTDDERFELFDGSAQSGTNLIEWTLAPTPKPRNQIIYSKVDKKARFGYGSEQEYWLKNFMRPRALQKYKGECFSIAAFATIDKVGKLDKVRLVEQKELFMDISADTAFLGAVKRMPNWVPAFKNGKPVASRQLIAINYCGAAEEQNQIEVVKPEAYAASMKLMLDKMLETSEDGVLYFSSKSLGWINCDRFYNDPRPKTRLLVDCGGQSADIKLIVKKFNGIMPMGRTKEKTYTSAEVPVGELVSVVGFRKEGNQMYFAMQDTKAENNKTVSLTFAPITETELKTKLKVLNGVE